jgi:hypothetical protein
VLVPARTQPVWPFPNKTAPMDSISDDKISTITSLNNEFFYKHFFEDWLDSESDDDSNLMVAMASFLHKQTCTHASVEGLRGRPSHLSGPQPRSRPHADVQLLLSPRNGIVSKLFSAPFSNVKEVVG